MRKRKNVHLCENDRENMVMYLTTLSNFNIIPSGIWVNKCEPDLSKIAILDQLWDS